MSETLIDWGKYVGMEIILHTSDNGDLAHQSARARLDLMEAAALCHLLLRLPLSQYVDR